MKGFRLMYQCYDSRRVCDVLRDWNMTLTSFFNTLLYLTSKSFDSNVALCGIYFIFVILSQTQRSWNQCCWRFCWSFIWSYRSYARWAWITRYVSLVKMYLQPTHFILLSVDLSLTRVRVVLINRWRGRNKWIFIWTWSWNKFKWYVVLLMLTSIWALDCHLT